MMQETGVRLCAATGCETRVPDRVLMCRTHWSKLGVEAQREMWRAYDACDRKPSKAPQPLQVRYLRAVQRCVAEVAAVEQSGGVVA